MGKYRVLAEGGAAAVEITPVEPKRPIPPSPAQPVNNPGSPLPTTVINNSAKPAEETVDDVIEAVLDLLLPNGFKAQDLRVIQPWIEATKKMVGTVAK